MTDQHRTVVNETVGAGPVRCSMPIVRQGKLLADL